MISKTNIMCLIFALFVMGCVTGCLATTQTAPVNAYRTNLTIEAEVAAVMEKYELWYQAADPEMRAKMEATFDKAFDKLDLLMDTYADMLASGMTTDAIVREIDNLKTRIMIELAKQSGG